MKVILTKENDPDNEFDLTDIKMVVNEAEYLDNLIDGFRRFLKACSFAEKSINEYLGDE